jgi:hypothetical protein
MKKILFGFVFSIAAATFVSCDMNNPNEDKFGADPQSGWVNFEQPGGEVTLNAGCGEVAVPFTLGAPSNESGLEVNYTLTDVVGSSAGLETRAFVPAGSRQGQFVITNADELTAPVEFILTLTSTSRSNVGIGFPGSPAQTMTVRVVPGMARYYATYNVVETSFEGEYEYESVVSQGASANELVISNLYGVDPDSETRVTVNADGTLSFPAFADNYLYTTGGGVMRYFEGLSGNC